MSKGKETDFARLLRKLRSKAIFSDGYISDEMLRARDDPQNYIVITAWQGVANWEKYESSDRLVNNHIVSDVDAADYALSGRAETQV